MEAHGRDLLSSAVMGYQNKKQRVMIKTSAGRGENGAVKKEEWSSI
jgi:hypothetical protein